MSVVLVGRHLPEHDGRHGTGSRDTGTQPFGPGETLGGGNVRLRRIRSRGPNHGRGRIGLRCQAARLRWRWGGADEGIQSYGKLSPVATGERQRSTVRREPWRRHEQVMASRIETDVPPGRERAAVQGHPGVFRNRVEAQL